MKKIVIAMLLVICSVAFVQAKTYTVVQDFNTAECVAGATKTVIAANALDGLYSITIDSTGTDTAYDVNVLERVEDVNYLVEHFSCATASEPYIGKMITSLDMSSNVVAGYPTNNAVLVQLTNAADLTACRAILKYSYDPAITEINDVDVIAAIDDVNTSVMLVQAGVEDVNATVGGTELTVEALTEAVGDAIFDDPTHKLYTDSAGRIMLRNK